MDTKISDDEIRLLDILNFQGSFNIIEEMKKTLYLVYYIEYELKRNIHTYIRLPHIEYVKDYINDNFDECKSIMDVIDDTVLLDDELKRILSVFFHKMTVLPGMNDKMRVSFCYDTMKNKRNDIEIRITRYISERIAVSYGVFGLNIIKEVERYDFLLKYPSFIDLIYFNFEKKGVCQKISEKHGITTIIDDDRITFEIFDHDKYGSLLQYIRYYSNRIGNISDEDTIKYMEKIIIPVIFLISIKIEHNADITINAVLDDVQYANLLIFLTSIESQKDNSLSRFGHNRIFDKNVVKIIEEFRGKRK